MYMFPASRFLIRCLLGMFRSMSMKRILAHSGNGPLVLTKDAFDEARSQAASYRAPE
jgi:hypothetical protein